MSKSDETNNAEKIRSLKDHARHILDHDGSDGGGRDMSERVTRLETHFEYIRGDLDEIKSALKVLPTLPTKQDLTNNILVAIGIGLAVMAIVIGGIVGGLAWLKT